MMKANFHTHHELCKHAGGTTLDYAKEALKHGFTTLGMSDHAPNSRIDQTFRMNPSDFPIYLEDIAKTKDILGDKLTIYTGLEVEYFDDHKEYYDFLLEHTDYLLLGQHLVSPTRDLNNFIGCFGLKNPKELALYADYVVEGIRSGYFDIVAHPDVYMNAYRYFDEAAKKVAHRICKAAKEHDVILEYNANGYRRRSPYPERDHMFPREEFWLIAKSHDCKIMIGSDCHNPKLLHDDAVKRAEEDCHKLGLKIIDFIPKNKLKTE